MSRRVLHFCDSTAVGGAERALMLLLAGQDRQHWQPMLAYHESAGVQELVQRARVADCTTVAVPPMPEGITGLRQVPGFVRTLRRIRPDVLHCHLTWQRSCKYALLAGWLARVPARIATVHLFVELPTTQTTIAKQRLFAQITNRYIAVSQAVAAQLVTSGIPLARIQVIRNAVRVPQPSRPPVQVRESLGIAADTKLVLTLARLDSQKGLNYLIDAAAQVPDATFLIAGDGTERAVLQDQITRLGLADRVRLLGQRGDVGNLLACCDLFVLPSLYEGLSLALLEALAAGKPVLATSIASNREAITHQQTGWLVPPANSQALADGLQLLLGQPQLASTLGRAAAAQLQHVSSVAGMLGEIEALYERVLLGGAVRV